jgi:hypothetical protein
MVAGLRPRPTSHDPHSERLSHSSTHVTREIYTHVTPPMQSDAAEHVAARIFRPL